MSGKPLGNRARRRQLGIIQQRRKTMWSHTTRAVPSPLAGLSRKKA